MAGAVYYILLNEPVPGSDLWWTILRGIMFITFAYFFGFLGFLIAGLVILIPEKWLVFFGRRE